MDLKQLKQYAMIGSGLVVFSHLLGIILSFFGVRPGFINELLALIGFLLIFLFFYKVYEIEQSKNKDKF